MASAGIGPSAPPATPAAVARRARIVFAVSVALTAVLYLVPHGRTIAYPLVLTSTLAHELGHGLTAILAGASFDSLRIWSDASGVATWSGSTGRIGRAAIAAGGLVGPAFAAFALLLLGRRARLARIGLGTLGAALLLVAALRVRNAFGLGFVVLLGALLVLLALKATDGAAQIATVFLAVQLALSVYSRGDYLFTAVAETAAGRGPSDVAVMSEALWLPYWLWGAVCAAISVLVLVGGMASFLGGTGTAEDHTPIGSSLSRS
jgi:hypothetical protein